MKVAAGCVMAAVAADIAVGLNSSKARVPTAARMAAPRQAASETAICCTGSPVTSALIWFHRAEHAPPPETRSVSG